MPEPTGKIIVDCQPDFTPEKADPGFYLKARLKEPMKLLPGVTQRIPTGVKLQVPQGWEGQIRGSSDLAWAGVIIPNAPATIGHLDRDEIEVLLMLVAPQNKTGFVMLTPGDRVGQIVFHRVDPVELVPGKVETGSRARSVVQ